MWKGPHTRVQKKHIMLSVMCVLVFAFLILLLFSCIIRMNHPRTRKNNHTPTQLLQTLLSFLVYPHQCPLGRHCSKQTTEAQECQQVVQARAMYQERKTTIDQCLRAFSCPARNRARKHPLPSFYFGYITKRLLKHIFLHQNCQCWVSAVTNANGHVLTHLQEMLRCVCKRFLSASRTLQASM